MGRKSEPLVGHMLAKFAWRRYTLNSQYSISKLKQDRDFRAISVMIEAGNSMWALMESNICHWLTLFRFIVSAKFMIKILPKYLGSFIKN